MPKRSLRSGLFSSFGCSYKTAHSRYAELGLLDSEMTSLLRLQLFLDTSAFLQRSKSSQLQHAHAYPHPSQEAAQASVHAIHACALVCFLLSVQHNQSSLAFSEFCSRKHSLHKICNESQEERRLLL